MLVASNYFNKKALGNLKQHTASGAFDAVLSPALLTVSLFQNNIGLTPDTVLSQLTVADFSGYADITPVVWGSIFQDGLGNYVQESALMQFLQTANTIVNTVYGYYVATSVDSGQLLISELFAAPVQMSGPDRAINLALRLLLGPESVLGSALLLN